MVKKINHSESDIKPIVLELEMELLNVQRALGKLETSIGLLQTGDKNGPFWNGSSAYTFLKSGCAQIDHDHYLLDNIDQCFEYLKKVSEKN